MKKILRYLSNGALLAGAITGIYALADSFIVRSRLPAGACPINQNKPIFYTSIVLCLLAFILSFFDGRTKKDRS